MVLNAHDRFDSETNLALSRFEQSFEYPLSETQNFRISHGEDYLRFFRNLGEVACFVVREGRDIEGILTTVVRTLQCPGLGAQKVVYLCDFKVSPNSRGKGLFLTLASQAKAYYAETEMAAYSVVMNGTARTPEHYSGRWGIPRFEKLSEIAILRVPVEGCEAREVRVVGPDEVSKLFRQLSSDYVLSPGRTGRNCSRYRPVGLMSERKKACGLLEDTLAGKRLVTSDCELVSAHLSDFAYESLSEGVELIRQALSLCQDRDIPALFLSVPKNEQSENTLRTAFPKATFTTASIYGFGLPQGYGWAINTSEV